MDIDPPTSSADTRALPTTLELHQEAESLRTAVNSRTAEKSHIAEKSRTAEHSRIAESSRKAEDTRPATSNLRGAAEGSESPEISALKQSAEIQELTDPEKIKILVRQHVSLWKRSKEAALAQDLTLLRQILSDAQENQKSLQKLIPNKEIESYVQGWNPWVEKKLQFPAPERTSGKAKRESHSEKRKNYNNPRKWKEISEMIQAAKGLYDSTD